MTLSHYKTYSTIYDNDVIQLPADIKSAFAVFEPLGCAVYLNAFHAGLINTKSLTNPRRDLTFVCVQTSEEKIIACGFKKHSTHPQTYTKDHHGITLLCHRYTAREHWMTQYALETQAFSCGALYIDCFGHPYDPTGIGIRDVMNGILRPLQDPIALFEANISNLFDCMEYVARGYKPTSALDTAIHYWRPMPSDNNDTQMTSH